MRRVVSHFPKFGDVSLVFRENVRTALICKEPTRATLFTCRRQQFLDKEISKASQ